MRSQIAVVTLRELDRAEDVTDQEAYAGETQCEMQWLPAGLGPQNLVLRLPGISIVPGSQECRDSRPASENKPQNSE